MAAISENLLKNLETLLDHLPESLPDTPACSEYERLDPLTFTVETEHIERYNGDEPQALCWVLGTIFHADNEWIITERGERICSLIPILKTYFSKYPKNPHILQWITNFINALKIFYAKNDIILPNLDDGPHGLVVVRKVAALALGGNGKLKRKCEASDSEDEDLKDPKNPEKDESVVFGPSSPLALLKNKYAIKSKSGTKKGRPADKIISQLSIKLWDRKLKKQFWACIGVFEGCRTINAGNAQKDRVTQHAVDCRYIEPSLKKLVSDTSAAASLGAALQSRDTTPAITKSSSQTTISSSLSRSSSIASAPSAKKSKFEHDFTKAGQEALQKQLDFDIMKLICVCGLVPRILDQKEWKEFMAHANAKYKPTPSDKFEKSIIPNEAQHIHKKVLDILKGETNLSISFDGNTTRKPQSIYTIHVTTKERDSYFFKGVERSDEHHTAEWVAEQLREASASTVANEIGPFRFALACSDSTGNTKKGRRIFHSEYPTIIDTGDCCHHFQLSIKDIKKLSEFKQMISILKKSNAFFSRSTISSTALRHAREDAGITGGGLVKIGKTRFATHYSSLIAFRRCNDTIKKLVSEGKAKPKDKDIRELYNNRIHMAEIETLLDAYIEIVDPLARSL
ncbi:hypothetical protein H0H81_004564 [Sphagnurus paluster]|uniref:DUF659 domain-containing protein n=1 Tax=Sphagnurus paluster TaxID=117069 RepID=A0A9P7FNF6_9AGAR|nr:hypothetical protein H0H81_004564 [Sphagnurus paluster]